MKTIGHLADFKRLLQHYSPEYMRKQARHDYHQVFQRTLRRIEPYVQAVGDLSVLDVGCGRRFPQTLLFHSFGAKIVGIDAHTVPIGKGFRRFSDLASESGFKQAAITYCGELCLLPSYYRELNRTSGFPLTTAGIDIRRMDACALGFADETFDLVISNATFEHILDVPKAITEIKRVMKRGAVGYIDIHLFASLSGAHNVFGLPGDTLSLGSTRPWAHLRKGYYSSNVQLNRLREREFKAILEAHFDILEWMAECEEGKEYLTSAILSELSDYTEDELLKRGVTAIVRK